MRVALATDIAHHTGFLAGVVLYAMLLAMVLARSVWAHSQAAGPWYQRLPLPLGIACLGLLWNLAGLVWGLLASFIPSRQDVLSLVALSTLGWFPALAIHSVWQVSAEKLRKSLGVVVLGGYVLGAVAIVWNGVAFAFGHAIPVANVWWMLAAGFLGLFVALLLWTKQSAAGPGGLVLVLLAVSSVATLPLSHHGTADWPWWFDYLGHHASVPFVGAVLYRDYRFTFVDRFMSRAVSLLLLVGITVGAYVLAVVPWFRAGPDGRISIGASSFIIALWVVTALGYSWLHRQVTWFLDVFFLRRPDYPELRRRLERLLDEHDTPEAVLGKACEILQQALRSREVRWERLEEIPPLPPLPDAPHSGRGMKHPQRAGATTLMFTDEGAVIMTVPTWEPPRYRLTVAPRADGHRFLSEEVSLVEDAAALVARRIDGLRTSHERCEVALREQEMQKLATEAELRALRAQVNPHFLFNALNTVGHLMDMAPARAATTLRDLTYLLRNILRRMEDNFTTLGEELDLVRAYLDIEQARFEERLSVCIDVPRDLHRVRVPALVLQPLVENAVKHGIQPSMRGGEIRIAARLTPELTSHGRPKRSPRLLCLEIVDTGVGISEEALRRGRQRGIGLTNVENRLRCLYGVWGTLQIVSAPGEGTTVTLHVPADEPASREVCVTAETSGDTP